MAAIVTNRAVEYRRLARQCMSTARTISTQERRDTLVQMAQVWLCLAEEQDAAIGPRLIEDQPVMQQLQQVQPKDDDKKE